MRVNACYDAIVIGDGLGAIAAGIALAGGGARTMLIPITNPTNQFTHLSTPFIEGLDLLSYLRPLGLTHAEISQVPPLNPSLQVVFPNQRFELGHQSELVEAALTREFAKDCSAWVAQATASDESAQQLLSILHRLPELPLTSWAGRWNNRGLSSKLRRFLRTQEQSHPFWGQLSKAMMKLMSSAVPPAALPVGLSDYWTALAMQGSYDGRQLRQLLLNHFQHKGGEILKRGQLKAIETQGKHVTHLSLQGGEFEKISVRQLICATYPHLLQPYLDDRRLKSWLRPLRIAFDRYLLPITLMKEGVPPGMASRTLIIRDSSKPLLQDNLLLIDRDDASPGHALLWLRFVVPHGTIVEKSMIKTLLKEAGRVIPFLNENQIPPFFPVQLHGHLYETLPKKDGLLQGLPAYTPWKNLFLASSANLPTLGLEGELMASLKHSYLVLEKAFGKDPGELVFER